MADRHGLFAGIAVIVVCAVFAFQMRAYAMEQTAPPALHTDGNLICGPDGKFVKLKGVNVPCLEWSREGEHLMETLAVAYDQWHCIFVRLPLCQDCWFGRVPGMTDGGAKYRSIVDDTVAFAARRGCYILLSDTGVWGDDTGRYRMPNGEAVPFWESLGARYGGNPAVLMGLYNEAHDVDWDTWLNGGVVELKPKPSRAGAQAEAPQQATTTYQAVGFQKLYDVTRAAGAKENLIVIGGLDWAYDLSGVAGGKYAIKGTNVVYDAHVYKWKPESSWNKAFLEPSKKLPVLVSEWGGDDSAQDFVKKFSQLLKDSPHLGWAAWDMHPVATPTLIKDWTFEPTETGKVVIEMLKARG
jgi:endoglucanase